MKKEQELPNTKKEEKKDLSTINENNNAEDSNKIVQEPSLEEEVERLFGSKKLEINQTLIEGYKPELLSLLRSTACENVLLEGRLELLSKSLKVVHGNNFELRYIEFISNLIAELTANNGQYNTQVLNYLLTLMPPKEIIPALTQYIQDWQKQNPSKNQLPQEIQTIIQNILHHLPLMMGLEITTREDIAIKQFMDIANDITKTANHLLNPIDIIKIISKITEAYLDRKHKDYLGSKPNTNDDNTIKLLFDACPGALKDNQPTSKGIRLGIIEWVIGKMKNLLKTDPKDKSFATQLEDFEKIITLLLDYAVLTDNKSLFNSINLFFSLSTEVDASTQRQNAIKLIIDAIITNLKNYYMSSKDSEYNKGSFKFLCTQLRNNILSKLDNRYDEEFKTYYKEVASKIFSYTTTKVTPFENQQPSNKTPTKTKITKKTTLTDDLQGRKTLCDIIEHDKRVILAALHNAAPNELWVKFFKGIISIFKDIKLVALNVNGKSLEDNGIDYSGDIIYYFLTHGGRISFDNIKSKEVLNQLFMKHMGMSLDNFIPKLQHRLSSTHKIERDGDNKISEKSGLSVGLTNFVSNNIKETPIQYGLNCAIYPDNFPTHAGEVDGKHGHAFFNIEIPESQENCIFTFGVETSDFTFSDMLGDHNIFGKASGKDITGKNFKIFSVDKKYPKWAEDILPTKTYGIVVDVIGDSGTEKTTRIPLRYKLKKDANLITQKAIDCVKSCKNTLKQSFKQPQKKPLSECIDDIKTNFTKNIANNNDFTNREKIFIAGEIISWFYDSELEQQEQGKKQELQKYRHQFSKWAFEQIITNFHDQLTKESDTNKCPKYSGDDFVGIMNILLSLDQETLHQDKIKEILCNLYLHINPKQLDKSYQLYDLVDIAEKINYDFDGKKTRFLFDTLLNNKKITCALTYSRENEQIWHEYKSFIQTRANQLYGVDADAICLRLNSIKEMQTRATRKVNETNTINTNRQNSKEEITQLCLTEQQIDKVQELANTIFLDALMVLLIDAPNKIILPNIIDIANYQHDRGKKFTDQLKKYLIEKLPSFFITNQTSAENNDLVEELCEQLNRYGEYISRYLPTLNLTNNAIADKIAQLTCEFMEKAKNTMVDKIIKATPLDSEVTQKIKQYETQFKNTEIKIVEFKKILVDITAAWQELKKCCADQNEADKDIQETLQKISQKYSNVKSSLEKVIANLANLENSIMVKDQKTFENELNTTYNEYYKKNSDDIKNLKSEIEKLKEILYNLATKSRESSFTTLGRS